MLSLRGWGLLRLKLKMLKAHKENLLKKLRTDKRKIDDLDYLIIDIQNNFKN